MHKIKNKKLLSILMSGIISYACVGMDDIYANENSNKVEVESNIKGTNSTIKEDNNTDTDVDNSENKDESNLQVELKNIFVSEINNSENIGLTIKTKGNITKIEENKIYIKDESGEGIVYLENISVNNLKAGDCISITGIVNQIEDINVVSVNDVGNIELVINEDNTTDEENKTEDNTTDNTTNEDDKTEDDLVEEDNKDNSSNHEANKPNKLNTNQNQSRPSNSNNVSKPNTNTDTSKLNKEEIVVNSIKAKDAIIIESDLSLAQWESVKLNLTENNIKVKDLKNNKIRITQVNNELGDNIWIVNDPRKLDLEEIKTIGIDITQNVLYSDYDVSESKWNTIVEDVKSGSCKIKYDSDKNIEVIYEKSNGKDEIITLNRIKTEES